MDKLPQSLNTLKHHSRRCLVWLPLSLMSATAYINAVKTLPFCLTSNTSAPKKNAWDQQLILNYSPWERLEVKKGNDKKRHSCLVFVYGYVFSSIMSCISHDVNVWPFTVHVVMHNDASWVCTSSRCVLSPAVGFWFWAGKCRGWPH